MKTTSKQNLNDFNQLRYGYPDENGHYGVFGGTFVAETLIQPLTDLKNTYYNLKNDNSGFRDPTGKYPLKEGPNVFSDTNTLASGDSGLPIINRQQNLDEMAQHFGSMFTFASISEPAPRYDAEYPFNHVRFTESGHVQEFDDTPGAERIHTQHRSGTFEEFGPDGERVLKVVNRNYTAILGAEMQ